MHHMVTVQEAERLILERTAQWGDEVIPLSDALGRVLAAPVSADRDMPPYDRVTMDGIAIRYAAIEKGHSSFHIRGLQPAGGGTIPVPLDTDCVEIMTGAALPASADTVIKYEDLDIKDGIAHVKTASHKRGQFIHPRGSDKRQGDILVKVGTSITPAVINALVTVGCTHVPTKRLPSVAVIASGDELVAPDATPGPFEIRTSNSYTIRAMLKRYGITPSLLHVPDHKEVIRQRLTQCLQKHDCLILSGGVSMGKLDFLPAVLAELGVVPVFHKVQQRPGKPFWFGMYQSKPVFAFPGNPVSTFLCMHRYFLPWLDSSLGLEPMALYAALGTQVLFTAPLQYFMQVQLNVNENGLWEAVPVEGNGSGDLANLVNTNAFIELPAKQDTFNRGDVYRVWPFIT